MALFGCRELINIGGVFVTIAKCLEEPCCQIGIWIWNRFVSNFVGLVDWKPCIDYLLYNSDNCGTEPDFNTFSSHKPDNNNYNFYNNIGNNQKQ